MYSDNTYRAFLLRMTDDETDAAIEAAILDGSVDPEYLRQIEEELIDDFLFGRLSEQEQSHFTSEFLCTAQRSSKLRFASALRTYSAQHAPQAERGPVLQERKRFAAILWSLPLGAALACALFVAVWLGMRNQNLNNELAQSRMDNEAAHRQIAEMLTQEEQNRHAALPVPSPAPVTPTASWPDLRLSSGTNRGLAAIPLLHLSKQASMASIELELPFDPHGALHEELLNSEDKTIWGQQFPDSSSISSHGVTIIMLPAAVLAPDDYRLQVEALGNRNESGGKITYTFRVRRD
jgi:hypothetical protein